MTTTLIINSFAIMALIVIISYLYKRILAMQGMIDTQGELIIELKSALEIVDECVFHMDGKLCNYETCEYVRQTNKWIPAEGLNGVRFITRQSLISSRITNFWNFSEGPTNLKGRTNEHQQKLDLIMKKLGVEMVTIKEHNKLKPTKK